MLEITGQVLLVPPFFENFGKRLIKSPKIYFTDTGLACHLLGIDALSTLRKSTFHGPATGTPTPAMTQSMKRLQTAIKRYRTTAALIHQGGDAIAHRAIASGMSALNLPQLLSQLD